MKVVIFLSSRGEMHQGLVTGFGSFVNLRKDDDKMQFSHSDMIARRRLASVGPDPSQRTRVVVHVLAGLRARSDDAQELQRLSEIAHRAL